MSELVVTIAPIEEVLEHPNADRLSIVRCRGWYCVSGLNQYKVGDLVIYCQPDAMFDEKLITYFFAGSTMHVDSPTSHRLRTVKIRKSISQGCVINFMDPELHNLYPHLKNKKEGDDVAEILNITKYEPPASSGGTGMKGNKVKKAKRKHPDFKEYTDIGHLANYPKAFEEDEEVYITEKLHGSSARYSLLPTYIPEGWKKFVLNILNIQPGYEFLYGSRRVQMDLNPSPNMFYAGKISWKHTFRSVMKGHFKVIRVGADGESEAPGNIYRKMVTQYDLEHKLCPGEELFGEIVGSGIQKNYTYGCAEGEHKFFAYDVSVNGKFLDPIDFIAWCIHRNIPHVPVVNDDGKDVDTRDALYSSFLYDVLFSSFNKYTLEHASIGDSNIKGQKVREGIVIKAKEERNSPQVGRVALKVINPTYQLDHTNSDFH